ncbi:hypothetical protein CW713_10435 [Methanophagales archaeon]|nr:MAG: hypothetical protein CW713_10435 [Methanophagales archaeon]
MEEIIMMKRANVRIRRNVQMAGFRTFIKNIADSLNVNGFAENVEDGSVRVVCEGEEDAIEGLINSVKESSPSFVRVEEKKNTRNTKENSSVLRGEERMFREKRVRWWL